MAPVVLGKYQDILDEYQLAAYSISDRQPRWEVCISSTLRNFGYALGLPFIEKVYDKTAKNMVNIFKLQSKNILFIKVLLTLFLKIGSKHMLPQNKMFSKKKIVYK